MVLDPVVVFLEKEFDKFDNAKGLNRAKTWYGKAFDVTRFNQGFAQIKYDYPYCEMYDGKGAYSFVIGIKDAWSVHWNDKHMSSRPYDCMCPDCWENTI